ncbi:hypothetical protein G6F30_010274 [Rhizopus arrhizus]|uniref:Golgi apparatus membrane protein TVP23 n=1 Tax=Rhizopus oryzae TaxID=64495 RepID=A0A9P6X3A0_RHIOR|nr:hypothetical protein G6F30_010274 [Rhizopus arrhizus]KAG1275892.1 hypothetical protein G6F65_009596 [Rhizopus arrhizus]KAG1303987.1 hypothetical protein G6F64_009596 [Rhizopus arrhizus]
MLFVYEILKKVEITLLKPKDNPDPVPRIIETSEAPPVEHLYNVIQRSANESRGNLLSQESSFIIQDVEAGVAGNVEDRTRNNNAIRDYFEQSSHPIAAFFFLAFRLGAILTYLLGTIFSDNFTLIFVVTILLLAFDFWTVKNVSGRLLVGLRWWNEIQPDGSNKWVFESAHPNRKPNSADSRLFWVVLYGTPIIWVLLALSCILTFKPSWLVIVAVAIVLSGANMYGYTQCDKDAKRKWATSMATQSALGTLSSGATGLLGRAVSSGIGTTQEVPILQQLDDGVRGIKLTAVISARDHSSIHLCHTFCEILDADSAVKTLNKITSWLEKNPKEVITIMWNNLYNIEASKIAQSYEASSIMPYIYTHKQSDPWPTLQEMIQSGKRVVNFIDAKANEEQIPWLMYQFSRVFETPFENTNSNDFNCNVDRIAAGIDSSDMMYVMNHFLYGVIDIGPFKIEIPLRNKAKLINSQLLIDHASNCTEVFQRKPNFIEVDFYTVGEALSLVATLNDAEFSGINLDGKFVAAEQSNADSEIHKSNLSPTQHILIDNTKSGSSSLLASISLIRTLPTFALFYVNILST